MLRELEHSPGSREGNKSDESSYFIANYNLSTCTTCKNTIAIPFLDQLLPQDLRKIRSKCWEARKMWMDIGIELNLAKSDLDTLQDRYKEKAEKCFTEMLDIWLQTNPRPMLTDLTAALRQRTVGFHQLAEELDREGLKSDRIKNHDTSNQLETAPTKLTVDHACQTCDTKLTNLQCTQVDVMNNETKQLKHIACSLAILVAIVAVFLALLSGLYFTNNSECALKFVCASPRDSFATGSGLEVAVVGERANVVLYIIDQEWEAYTTAAKTVECEVIHESTDLKLDCGVKKSHRNQYEISYQPTSRGRHQLHVKVEGKHIKGSPFTVTVTKTIITGLKEPWDVAVNQEGEILVVERYGHCVSIFSPTGEKLGSFGSHGSGLGELCEPRGVTVDSNGNVLVTDVNHRIQKFSSEHKFITSVGSQGTNHLQFHYPFGLAISPTSNKIAIADDSNHRVQILNPDLTFSSSIGRMGNGSGQFNHSHDVAFDSTGNMHVTDSNNHRVQVFNPEGKFLRQFGKKGKGTGELLYPTSICIDSDDTVYVVEYGNHRVSVFTCEGTFLTSFGSLGDGPGQFKKPRAITMDKNGIFYVSDTGNNRIQTF